MTTQRLELNILRLLRPRQWIKNFAIFAAIVFSGQLFNPMALEKVLIGFFLFCGLSSAAYIVNDIFDIQKDRLHPFKKFRPLAHGDIPIPMALTIAAALIVFCLYFSFYLTPAFFIVAVAYVAVQLLYSIFLKGIAVIDILAIASGYIIRVYAGAFVSGYHISVWLLLTTISLALFLAIGKRRSELTLVSQNKEANIAAIRKTLSHYSERLLDLYASIFATSTFISYALFTFLESPQGFKPGVSILLPEFLPAFFQRKWLMITIIPVVYGLMRYLQDIYEKHEGESPEKVLLSDKALLSTVLLWIIMVLVIIYVVGP
ncbi:MAG: decaprenyl-phosphate phosphoribosyltransferase [Candidatus Levyibacteriota bacterium]